MNSIIPSRINYLFSSLLFLFLCSTASFAQVPDTSDSFQEYCVRYASPDFLNLRSGPSKNADVLRVLSKYEKLIVHLDRDQIEKKEWIKVTYPYNGFVYGSFLLNEREIDSVYNGDYFVRIRLDKTIPSWSPVEMHVEEDSDIAELIDKSKYVLAIPTGRPDTSLVISTPIEEKEDLLFQTFWANELDVDTNGYFGQANLYLKVYLNKSSGRDVFARIFAREENSENYRFIHQSDEFEIPEMEDDELAIWLVNSFEKHLAKGSYNFRVELIDVTNYALVSSLQYRIPHFLERKFEDEGPPPYNYNEISIFGALSYPTIPVEKHFEIKKHFWGGGIEYTRSNWFVGIGSGCSRMIDAMNADSTKFTTKIYYGYLKLSITRLVDYLFDFNIDSDLDIYATVGGTSWESKFQKIKYSNIKKAYNVEMDSKGNGYLLGFGARYHFYNIILGVQYQLLDSKVTEFSKPVTYTLFDGTEYTATDRYNVFPGFQQLQFLLGYRIQF